MAVSGDERRYLYSMPIPPPTDPPPLRLKLPLPPYRYLPGEGPHPLRHPDGHSRDPAPLDPEAAWLRGLDLYDHRYYWESHEVWEAVWKATPQGSLRQLLQGLIQLAAATIKHHLGHNRPASLLLSRAGERIDSVVTAQGAEWRGLDLPATLDSVQGFIAGEGSWPVIVPAQAMRSAAARGNSGSCSAR
jgi:hypothetical protein